jgi:hypothetical protein
LITKSGGLGPPLLFFVHKDSHQLPRTLGEPIFAVGKKIQCPGIKPN